jgi:hypothetical protein
MVSIVPFFLSLLLNVHTVHPDADSNESATVILQALGMFRIGWRYSAETISDWVIRNYARDRDKNEPGRT